jgi:hypothetical protein
VAALLGAGAKPERPQHAPELAGVDEAVAVAVEDRKRRAGLLHGGLLLLEQRGGLVEPHRRGARSHHPEHRVHVEDGRRLRRRRGRGRRGSGGRSLAPALRGEGGGLDGGGEPDEDGFGGERHHRLRQGEVVVVVGRQGGRFHGGRFSLLFWFALG